MSASAYQKFLKGKRQRECQSGFPPIWMPDFLFDFQSHLVDWAIRKGRAALFADCGLGKTPMSLVWAKNVVRKTNKPVLILTPLAVSYQFVREGEKFDIRVRRSPQGEVHRGINVVNYERLKFFNPRDFAGVYLDESSMLKSFGGKYRRQITEFLSKVRYCLLGSATPAPNDWVELGNSSEVCGEMGRNQMLRSYFVCDEDPVGNIITTHNYRLKGYAKESFWEWVGTWARAIRVPSDLGYEDGGFILPEMSMNQWVVGSPQERRGFFLPEAMTLAEQRRERRATLKLRCEKVAELVPKDRPFVAWCHLNAEGDLLEKLIPDAVQVAGANTDDEKESRLDDFGRGNIRVLVTKPRIGGFGLNWQHCSDLSFFPSHCYDEATELLTKRGWIGFGDVSLSDEVATVNQGSLSFEWQHPTDVIWDLYSGPMIRFGSKGHCKSFDLLVTPNHRMFVKRCDVRYRTNSGKWEFQTAAKLKRGYKRQEYRMLSVPSFWSGCVLDCVEMPPYSRKLSRSMLSLNKSGDRRGLSLASLKALDKGKCLNISSLPIETFLSLAGWYLSEGYCGSRHGELDGQVTICQTEKNPENRRDIIKLLKSIVGLNVYHKTKDIRCCSIQLASFLVSQFGAGSRNKYIPRWVKELDVSHLKLLRDVMLRGDGSGSKGREWYYRTVSKRLADDFAEICIKTGIRASVRHREKTTRVEDSDCYDVNLARQCLQPFIHVEPERVNYSGMVGCVTVPNGLVIVRRSGIPVVSGNSFEQYYQAVRRCWRFGQKRKVMVRIVTSEGESRVLKNMLRKEKIAAEMYASLVGILNRTIKKRDESEDGFDRLEVEVPEWLTSN